MKRLDNNSTLGFAILGLTGQQAQSGYDLRKFFSSTPMRSFSDSPGAIYPALQRLERRGLVRGVLEQGRNLRRRKIFHITARGRAEFKRWLAQPITRDDLVRNMNVMMLRFAFMDQFAGRGAAERFLRALQRELAAYLPGLRTFLKANRAHMATSGRLALESGIQGYETHLRWARTALANYTKTKGELR
jgi:DNA-binding PadR family transcriptional regulator